MFEIDKNKTHQLGLHLFLELYRLYFRTKILQSSLLPIFILTDLFAYS